MRIVSLIASSTEIVHALGLGHFMVGRSHECDFPLTVKALPVCTSPKFDVEGSSYEIDQRVKAILEQSLSVYKVDAQILDGLSPTHVITQAQCEVCAVSLKDVEEAACQMVKSRPRIISLEPNCLDDYFKDLLKVGRLLGVEKAAKELIERDKSRIRFVQERASKIEKKLTVAVIEWIEPMMAAGNWMPELVELAGGINLFGTAGKHSPWMKIEDLTRLAPDVIIVTPCGFDNQRTRQEMPVLTRLEQFMQLKAAQSNRVYIADGNQYFNRPGPRLIDSLEIMAEMLYPEIFPPAHAEAWQVYKPTNCGGL